MSNFVKFFVLSFVTVLFASCADDSTFNGGAVLEEVKVPTAFIPTGEGKVDIIFDDDSRVPFQHSFQLSAEAERRFKGTAAAVCTDDDYKTASDVVTFAYNVCENNVNVKGFTLEYSYKGKTYTLGLPEYLTLDVICRLAVEKEETTPSFYAESVADYSLLIGETKLASAATRFIVEEEYIEPQPEDPKLDHVEWNYNHVSFQRNAELSNGVINVLCNNIANFVDIMNDQSQKNAEEVSYTVVNKFNFSAPAMEVNSLNDVVGKTFNFNNGTATVEGFSVKATWTSATVEGKVMHNSKDYAREIVACRANAKTITFNSASEATIRFYDENANDYAEAIVPVTVSEKVTLKNIIREFMHKVFRKNAVVNGTNIAITCDNEASFVKEYSNNAKDAAVVVPYTVVNNFTLNMPELVVNNMSNILNKTYNFNNGTAVIEGKNVTVSFRNRAIADIMFEGKNYKNEAPKCEVEVKTIKITSANTATITFVHDNEVVTAIVPVSIIEAEVINGEIKALWSTDAYKGRTFARTDLHVLAEKDGAYVVYSRQNKNESWTITNLSAAEGQAVIASQRALAWYWLGNSWFMGTVKAIENEAAGYILQYFTLDNQLANNLGKSESTLNGKKFEYPIHGTGYFKDGMWTINYGGTTSYFVSNN